MRKFASFIFGLTLGMWGDAALVEFENTNWWRLFSPSSVEFKEQRPGATWYYEETPARKLG